MRKFYSFVILLTAMLCGIVNRAWGETMTVADGSVTNSYIPIYGLYIDESPKEHMQILYPSSDLEDMSGGTITGLTYYSGTATQAWGTNVCLVQIAEVNDNTMPSSSFLSGSFSTVYEGHLGVSSNQMNITFPSSNYYSYGGGNLLIDITVTTTGSYSSVSFYGIETTYTMSRCLWSRSSSSQKFIPKTTFTYQEAVGGTCPKPGTLTGTPASSTSATITWKRKGSETAWDLQYSDDNFTTHTELNLTTSEVDVDGSDNCSYTLTGLEPLTSYKIKVQANCGVDDVSDYTSTSSFTTPCPEENLPFYENFNCLSSGVPEYWDNSQGDMTSQNDSYRWNYFATGHTGACVRFNSYNTSSGKYNYLYTRAIKIHEAATFSFWYKNPTGGDFSVSYKINGGSETPLVTGLTGKSSWTQYTYNFSAQDAEKNIVFIFKATSNFGSGDAYIYLDDVSLSRTSCSSQPSGLTASSVDGNSAQLSWTSSGSTWGMRYRANCGDWVEINNLTSKTYSLTGLEPTTDYEVQVKTVCGVDEESAWSESATFRTTCGAISALPWSYGFEGVTTSPASIPECWGRTPDDTNIGAVAANVRTGSRAMKLYGGTESTVRTLVLPEFSAAFSSLKIEFYYKMDYTNASYGSPIIGYINTDGTFKGLDTLTQYNSYTKAEYTFPSSYEDTPAKIAIRFAEGEDNNNYRRNLYIDDITVSSIMQCEQPLSVMASNILDITARVSWSARPGITSYQYCVVGEDEDPDWSGNLTTETNSVDLSGLTASTTYDFYVRCVCGVGEYSDVSAVCQFTTLAGCPTPGTVEKSNQTACGVTLTWTAGGGETGWNVHYKPYGGAYCDPIHVTSPTYNMTGLTTGTTYYYQVQADCEGDWTSAGAYTPVCPVPGVPTFSNQTYNSVRVSWTAGNCEDTWNIRYKVGDGDWTVVSDLTSRSYDLSDMETGETYTFQVQAGCAGTWSTASTYTPVCPQPGAITLSNQKYNSVTVAWAVGGTEDHWRLRYKADGDADWTVKEANTDSHSGHVISGLTSGVTYTIEVTASCCAGGAARTITYTPECAQPGSINLSSKTYNSVVVGWNTSGTIDSWNLQYKLKAAEDVPANWTTVASNTTSRSGHSISGLTTNTAYTIRVTAACCDASPRDLDYTPVYTAPGQPSVGSQTETSARITWSAVSDATGYQYVLVAANAAADWTKAVAATTPLDLSGLTPGTSYDVYVRSVYPTGYSAASTKRNFTTTTVNPSISGASPTELTSSSATFAWTKSGYTTGVKYQWKIGSGSWSDPISATSVTVDGLSANTSYTFYVRSYYSASVQSSSASKTFKTTCAEIVVDAETPWEYGFEDVSAGYGLYNYPDCWNKIAYGNYPYVDYSSYRSGSRCLKVYGGSSTSAQYAILPPFADVNTLTLSFYYKAEEDFSGYVKFIYAHPEIGYMTNIADASSFVRLGSALPQSESTYTLAEQVISGVPEGGRLAIRYADDGTVTDIGTMYIDDIVVSLTPNCRKPVDGACSAVTPSSATLQWTESGPATEWEIEYSTNSDFSRSTTVSANSNPFALTGLSEHTIYYARVRGVCDVEEKSDWSNSFSFKTSYSMPFNETFNTLTSGIPTDWDNATGDVDASYQWQYYPNGKDSKCVRFNSYYPASGKYNELKTPAIYVDASAKLSFYCKNPTGGDFSVYYSVEGGEPEEIDGLTGLTSISDWTKKEVTLPAGCVDHSVVLIFKATSNYGSGDAFIYLDEVNIFHSSCTEKVTDIDSEFIAPSSADLTWTSSASEWWVRYRVGSGDWIVVKDITTNAYTITGLRSALPYEAQVAVVCGENSIGEWCPSASECAMYQSDDLAYIYGFESETLTGSGNIPFCWNSISYLSGSTYYPHVSTTSGRTAAQCLVFNGGQTDASEQYIILPEMEEPLSELTLDFYYKNGSAGGSYPQFTVGYMTNPGNAATFTSVSALSRSTSYTSASVDFKNAPASAHYIAIKYSGATSYSYTAAGYIDDIALHTTAKVFQDKTGDGQWKTAGNWMMGAVPTISDNVVIRKPVTVDGSTLAKAKSVAIDQINTRTGSIEIEPTGRLVIADSLRKVTGAVRAKVYSPTTENDLYIGSSAAGLGALAIGNHTTVNGLNNATISFYTLSSGSKGSSASVAQYVGTPFSNEPEMLYQFYNSWMYKYVNTGTPDWERVNGGDGLKAFEGYCVFSADAWDNDGGHTYWMQGTLVASQDKEIDLVYNGDDGSNPNNENMLANSWMAPIKINAFQASDFTNTDATIYIFNSGSPDNYEDNNGETTSGTLPGQYTTYTPGSALATDVIPSMQAFSVYTNNEDPSKTSSITLDYSRLVYDPAVTGLAVQPNKAPRRASAEADEPEKMRLYINAESGYGDMLYMLEREDFAEGFENGWDGRKMFGDEVAPQLYAFTPDGNMAINCVPTFEGQVLGFRKGTQDNVYTFTFEYDGYNTWYLNDLKEQTSTLINPESTYMFLSGEDDMTARFIISATPIHYMPTGIQDSEVRSQDSGVRKLVIDDHVFIIRDGRMYDATGVMVR